jgi:Zn-dependent protease with chaperone function
MKTWFASYYDAPGAEPVEASVLASEKFISFAWRTPEGELQRHQWSMNDIMAVIDRTVDGSVITSSAAPRCRLVIKGKDATDFILQVKEEKAKPWHKKKGTKEWIRGLGIFSGFIGILIAAYFLLVPWLSEKFASRVSVSTEQQFGDAVYNGMQLAAAEDQQASAKVNSFFEEMHITTPYTVRIAVIKGDVINAFALPGGRIVVYTALLDQLKTYPELAALLSHEFTHVNNRHSTKSVFRKLGSKIFLGLLLGNTGGVAAVLADQADDLKSLTYSRSLEKEADLGGLALLKERQIDPEGFTGLFQQLKKAAPASSIPEFLASHPDIENRIGYIREASKNERVKEDTVLKAIFEQLKTR